MASTFDADRTRAVQLGAELRDARKRAGKTVEQVAKALGYHHSTVSRWERGESMPDQADTGSTLIILGVTGEERDQLVKFARHEGVSDWITTADARKVTVLADGERSAHKITEVNPLLVPGLLQTTEYCQSIMTAAGISASKVEQAALLRMGRQNVLTRRNPVKYVAVTGEQVLRYPACDYRVMVEQLHHLLTMAERPNVEIRVLPLKPGYSLALEGQFILLELDHGNLRVHVDGCGSASTITSARAVDTYQKAAESIHRDSLSSTESVDLIRGIAKEMEAQE